MFGGGGGRESRPQYVQNEWSLATEFIKDYIGAVCCIPTCRTMTSCMLSCPAILVCLCAIPAGLSESDGRLGACRTTTSPLI